MRDRAEVVSRFLMEAATSRSDWRVARRLACAAAAAVLILTLLSACLPGISEPGLGDGVVVRNETELTLTFRLFTRGTAWEAPTEVGPREEAGVLPGNTLRSPTGPGEDGCTVGDLVALGPDGAEVARHPPPLCTGEVWV